MVVLLWLTCKRAYIKDWILFVNIFFPWNQAAKASADGFGRSARLQGAGAGTAAEPVKICLQWLRSLRFTESRSGRTTDCFTAYLQ
jgi:hypothetical protein